jgi:nucleotide-binding universal stress UspA family protein
VKTLICVAGMPYAEPTVRFGNLVAGLGASEVTLLKVIGKGGERESAEETLRRARKMIDVPLSELKVRQGQPVDEIIRESSEGDYDLIVVGERIVKGVFSLLLQSTARKVTSRAPSSVLVVKEPPLQLKRILICSGGRQVNRDVVKLGGRLAREAGAEVKLLHVTDAPPGMYTGLTAIEETLPELLQSNTPISRHLLWGVEVLAGYEVSAELVLHRGIAVDEILDEARRSNCDLLVIGAQVEKTTWLDDLLMSTVTPQVVDRSPCSVLVVRSRA